MHERLAAIGVGTTLTLFGLTLAELADIARIVAGFAAGFSGVAAGIYYLKKARKS